MKPSIALIGAGTAGSALLIALQRKGYPPMAVSSRTLQSAQHCAALVGAPTASTDPLAASTAAEIVIIGTPDGVIRQVCEEISGKGGFRAGQLVLHLSGALSSDTLAAAARLGADTCAMHPIQTLAQPAAGARLLETAWYCLEGEAIGIARAGRLAKDLSGRVLNIDKASKTLYHAALCMASNYLVVLEKLAADLLVEAGIDREAALPAMLPLISGAVDNLANCGLPGALTGPISRGDAETLEKHLRELEKRRSKSLELYKSLAKHALPIALAKGKMDPEGALYLTRILAPDD